MNKKRNFAKTALLGVLLCGLASPTFVGCKDYDDDIDGLQEQVNTLNKSFEDLKKLVNEGKAITSVTPITGGFKIAFNDGTSYDIVNGKNGNDGSAGVGSVVKVENGHLFIDNVDKGKVVNETAEAPVITIKDGFIHVNGVKQEGAQLGVQSNASYAVDHEKFVEFYVVGQDGTIPVAPVKVWKNAALSGLLTIPNYLVNVAENGLLFPTIYGVDAVTGKYVRLYAGKADLKYQVNPKGAAVENPEFVKQQIVARSASKGIVISDVKVDNEYLTLRGKAMSGLFSYNRLEDENLDPDSYIFLAEEKENMIDPLFNIIALKVQSQGEELISDYVMGFDYNISQNDVTIEKIVVVDGEDTYEVLAHNTAALAKDGMPEFTLLYKEGKGTLDLNKSVEAFFVREGFIGTGKFKLTENGFDEHTYSFEKVEYLFTDKDGNKKDHGSYVTLDKGVLTVKEASDEKGSSIGRTPIVKITLKSNDDVNHGKIVKTVYAKVIISETEVAVEVPAYTQEFDYVLNNIGSAKYLSLDKLYGHVAEYLNLLGSEKFHATYATFSQIMDDDTYDTDIQLAKTTTTTGSATEEWLAAYVPNYKKAGTYKVKGVFKSANDEVYPPVYVIYTVNVKYPVGPYLTKRTNADQGGNFWEGNNMLVNGVFDAANDYKFKMGGKISDAFVYNLPYDENPWNTEWNWNAANHQPSARANIQYTFANVELNAAIEDVVSAAKETWLGNISVTKLPNNADYREIEVQPITWFNLDLNKMINNKVTTGTISTTDGLKTMTEGKFTVRFISPLKSLIANGGELDKNNTTIDQKLDIKKTIVVKDKKDAVLYENNSFRSVSVGEYLLRNADHVYAIGAPKFAWGDDHSATFAAEMEQRGGKCTIDENTGIITFHATGEVGAVNLKVKVSMDCPWRKLETIVTVSVK